MPHGKVLREFLDKTGQVAMVGTTVEGSSTRIQELAKKGLVVQLMPGDDDSFRQRQSGGPTGEAVIAPSSPVAPLLSKTLSPKRKGRKSRSSQ